MSYDVSIDNDVLWQVVHDDLPVLVASLRGELPDSPD
jgi:hypothetical protein